MAENNRGRSFSLLTLLLVVAIVALGVSHYVMMRQVGDARREAEAAHAELDAARKQFGYLRIEDPQKIYVTKVEGTGASGGNHYRLHVPPGHRFLLHVGETEYAATGPVGTPKRLATLSMNSWRDGADVILHWSMSKEGEVSRLKVWTDTDELFDVQIPDHGKGAKLPNSAKYVAMDAQQEFVPGDRIEFFSYGNEDTKRGVVMWMDKLPAQGKPRQEPGQKN